MIISLWRENNYAEAKNYTTHFLTFSSSVESIGKYTFGSCSELETVTIRRDVKTIGNYAFESYSLLKASKFRVQSHQLGIIQFHHVLN